MIPAEFPSFLLNIVVNIELIWSIGSVTKIDYHLLYILPPLLPNFVAHVPTNTPLYTRICKIWEYIETGYTPNFHLTSKLISIRYPTQHEFIFTFNIFFSCQSLSQICFFCLKTRYFNVFQKVMVQFSPEKSPIYFFFPTYGLYFTQDSMDFPLFFPWKNWLFLRVPEEDLRDLGLGMVERRRVLRWAMSAEPQLDWQVSHMNYGDT